MNMRIILRLIMRMRGICKIILVFLMLTDQFILIMAISHIKHNLKYKRKDMYVIKQPFLNQKESFSKMNNFKLDINAPLSLRPQPYVSFFTSTTKLQIINKYIPNININKTIMKLMLLKELDPSHPSVKREKS